MTDTTVQSNFLKACLRQETDATPIWLMRQAGRYMAEYRELRGQYDSILDLIKQPELACEVTLQPMNAFDLDVAIIFADILPPLEGMGLDLSFVQGEGPQIANPVRSAADVERLRTPPATEALSFTLDAVRITRQELDTRGKPLIGFSGAPFTLAAYAIEGGGSKNHRLVKSFMIAEPEAWQHLMEKFVIVISDYMIEQARAGAHVLQLFDSWVGQLAPQDYERLVMPYSRQVIETVKAAADVPVIHFGTETNGMLPLIRGAGGDVIGVDWRIPIDHAWDIIGHDVAIQGNLDPVALFAPWEEVKARAQHILDAVGGRPGHIFNLGHGILQETPVDNVKRLVDFVHEYSANAR